MKNVLLNLMFITLTSFVFSQTPVLNNTININQNFTTDTEIFPFNNQTLYGIGISGNITFNCDTSLVRIIIGDNSGHEYMIYETYPMLDTIWNFTFNEECEESCFLEDYIGTSLIIQIQDASIYLSQLKWSSSPSENVSELQVAAKYNSDQAKIQKINAFIASNNMLWTARYNYYGSLFYREKKELYGDRYNSFGFEFYSSGIFSIDALYIPLDPTPNIVDHFDWREKHNANIQESSYFDNNPDPSETRNGWMTAVKCQSGCWDPINYQFECYEISGQCPLGWEPKTGLSCIAFTAIGTLEAMLNIYYNQHIDFDLSEMELAAQINTNLPHPCRSECNGGSTSHCLQYIGNYGIMDDASFPYWPLTGYPCPPCDLQNEPQEVAHISNYYSIPTYDNELLKKSLILYGPMTWSHFEPSSFVNHAMVCVGFGTIYEGQQLYWFDEPIPPYSPHIGKTYWIFKHSGGPYLNDDGYFYMMLDENPDCEVINTPITLENETIERFCLDKDHDGLYNWGIGDPPDGCLGEMDGNDDDPSLGPMDENGFCKIIDTHFTSFEGTLEGWKQVTGADDGDWRIHNPAIPYTGIGPLAPTTVDGDNYIFIPSTYLEHLQSAILESPLIDYHCSYTNQLSFWYYIPISWGAAQSVLKVIASEDGGASWPITLWSKVLGLDETTGWFHVSLTFPSSINKLRLYAKTGNFTIENCNFAFDAITLTKTYDNGQMVIGENQQLHINSDFNACNNIIIEHGGILTIDPNVTLFMPVAAKIIIKRGGKLEINGGTITNAGNSMWKGIEVWGTSTAYQNPVNQGVVQIFNGGTIENAECGIRAVKMSIPQGDGEESPDYDYTGGIVFANDARFVNNKTAVRFYSYPQSSMSYFYECEFETNTNLISGVTPDYFMWIDHISGIDITDCSFNNTTGTDYLHSGIYAHDATFSIEGRCTTPVAPCNQWENGWFRKLNYAVYVVNTNTIYYPDIRHTDFNLNRKGIYISTTDGARVTSCDFNLPIVETVISDYYGLYLNNSFAYHVEDNDFVGPEPAFGSYGVYVNNSGEHWNQVYNNRFSWLTYGTFAYGLNRITQGLQVDVGLCIECNDYDHNKNDIYVYGLMGSTHGIAKYQGQSTGQNDTLPASNTFSENFSNLQYNYKNSKGLAYVRYAHHYHLATSGKIVPYPFYNNLYTMQLDENPLIYYEKTTACPSKLNPGGGGPKIDRDGMDNAGVEIVEQETLIQGLVDGGDTYSMNMEVVTSSPPEASEVYEKMMNESPFLSDTVMKSAVYKENVLPNAMIRDILVANPQSAKNNEILEAVDDRFEPMPEWMKEQILEGAAITGAKEALEAELSKWQKKYAEHFNNLYQKYRKDTFNLQASWDTLEILLVQDNRLESRYRLAFLKAEKDGWSEGLVDLNAVPSSFELTAQQQIDHQQYVSLFNILDQLNGDLPDAESSEAAALNELAEDEESYPGACARDILYNAGLIEYLEPVVIPEFELKSTDADNKSSKLAAKPESLKLFPNPAGDYVIVEYNTEGYTGDVLISITDITGKTIFSEKFTNKMDQFVLKTAEWSAGVYQISAFINGRLINSGKVTIKK